LIVTLAECVPFIRTISSSAAALATAVPSVAKGLSDEPLFSSLPVGETYQVAAFVATQNEKKNTPAIEKRLKPKQFFIASTFLLRIMSIVPLPNTRGNYTKVYTP
jgi:hypothetical protein